MRGDTCAGLEIILTITINMSLRVIGLLHELSRRHVENENAKRVPRGRPATRQGFWCKDKALFVFEVDKKGKVVVVSLPRGVLCFGVQGPKHSSGRMHRPRTHSTVSRPRPREAGFPSKFQPQPQPDRLITNGILEDLRSPRLSPVAAEASLVGDA